MIYRLRSFFILFFTFLLIPFLLPAQEIIFQSCETFTYKIPFHPEKGGYSYANEILREIAREVLKEPGRVNIRLNYTIKLEIRKDRGANQLKVFLLNPAVTGDVRYRKFSISGMLLPSGLSMEILWAKKNNLSHVSLSYFNEKVINNSENLILTGRIPAFNPLEDTLFIRNEVLAYDSLDLTGFRTKLRLINDYYACIAILDTLDLMHTTIKLEEAGEIPLSFIKVEESDKIMDLILQKNFPERLLKQDSDFLNLMGRFKSTNRNARSIHFNFLDLLSASGAISRDGDIKRYADYYTLRMLSYIRRAQLMGEMQGGIYQDYLDNWFSYNVFQDDLYITETILAKMFPDARRDTLVGYMSKRIYQSYQQLSLKLMAQDQFADARALMEHANIFRERNPFLKNGQDEDEILGSAANGIYLSYIGIASSCIEAGKPEMAGKYLDKAEAYRQRNRGFIRNDSLYRKALLDLFFLRWNGFDRLSEDQRIREALHRTE